MVSAAYKYTLNLELQGWKVLYMGKEWEYGRCQVDKHRGMFYLTEGHYQKYFFVFEIVIAKLVECLSVEYCT